MKTQTTAVSMTECNRQLMMFQDLFGKKVEGDFAGGYVSSDGGALLLRQADGSTGLLKNFARCFKDFRRGELVEFSLEEMLRQRVYGLALGYEDLNDHDGLRYDPLLAVCCEKRDPQGRWRRSEKDRGKGLCGKSTLNRLELTPHDASERSRYKKIVFDAAAMEDFFISEWVRSLDEKTREVILDFDVTDDPLYGKQEGRFFHGYYGEYCYLPLYVFCGDFPIVAWLRESGIDASAGSEVILEKIVQKVRSRFPKIKIILRGDSGFCRHDIMRWCEANRVDYILGLAKNSILNRQIASEILQAKQISESQNGEPARVFKEFFYAAESWDKKQRRVIAKAEWTQNEANPRYIITTLDGDPRRLYENIYCARGEMENMIKQQHLDLKADRTSTHVLRSNQLRLWFSTLAYLLLIKLKHLAPRGTQLANATCGTIRLRLLKIGAILRITARRIHISFSSAFPLQPLFRLAASRLGVNSG